MLFQIKVGILNNYFLSLVQYTAVLLGCFKVAFDYIRLAKSVCENTVAMLLPKLMFSYVFVKLVLAVAG